MDKGRSDPTTLSFSGNNIAVCRIMCKTELYATFVYAGD